jgi:hypothetical protein
MEDHDPVADAVILDSLAHCCYYSGGFVSEDARGGVRAGRDFFEVCAADAAGVYADQHLSGADRGYGDGLKADVIDSTIDGGLHRRGDGTSIGVDRVLSGDGHGFG